MGLEGTDAVGATTGDMTPSVALFACSDVAVSPLATAPFLLNVFISTRTFSCSKAAMILSVFFAVVYGLEISVRTTSRRQRMKKYTGILHTITEAKKEMITIQIGGIDVKSYKRAQNMEYQPTL